MDADTRIAELRRALEYIRDHDPLEDYTLDRSGPPPIEPYLHYVTIIRNHASDALNADDAAARA
jgi:hypothetical protein